MKITKQRFGTLESGEEISVYTLKNKNGMEVSCIDYGAILKNVLVPDKKGIIKDVALGCDTLERYVQEDSALGAFVGRHANRIKDAKFELNGIVYELEQNDNGNNLHGGTPKYNKVVYEADIFEDEDSVSVEFSRLSRDMEQGFPGNLDITVTYTLTEDNELVIEYLGVPDKDTVVNLTNHSYFNLAGHNSGTVVNHKVQINAEQFTPTDSDLIPTGEYRNVEGTPMDFRVMKAISQDINADYDQLHFAKGYDHNFVLKHESNGEVELVATCWDEESGRLMEVYTDRPGIQMYTGNALVETNCKDGASYKQRDGVCFETQNFPNAINTSGFPCSVVKAGEEFNTVTVYKFSVK